MDTTSWRGRQDGGVKSGGRGAGGAGGVGIVPAGGKAVRLQRGLMEQLQGVGCTIAAAFSDVTFRVPSSGMIISRMIS